MAEHFTFNGITRLDLPADRVLDNAPRGMEGVVIMGYDKDGNEYFASSWADGGTPLWLIERFKHQLIFGAQA
jgi:hypothetical protein